MRVKQDVKQQQEAAGARRAMAGLTKRLAVLDTLTVVQLQAEYEQLFGEPTRSRNGQHLRKRLAWKIQEQAEGGLSPRALDRIEELAPTAPARWRQPAKKKGAEPGAAQTGSDAASNGSPVDEQRAAVARTRDPRLPEPGTVIRKTHKGVVHEITVLDSGFEHAGQHYGSLSAIARVVTGTPWNGYLWLGMAARKPKVVGASNTETAEQGEDSW